MAIKANGTTLASRPSPKAITIADDKTVAIATNAKWVEREKCGIDWDRKIAH